MRSGKFRGGWVLGVLCLAATVRAAGSRADGVAEAPARSGELVAHPLLTEAGTDALAELSALRYRDSDEVLARLTWGSDAGHSMSVPGPAIDGVELEDLLQSTVFYNAGFQGSGNLGYAETDGFKLLQDNLGFEDGAGALRIHPMECLLGTFCWDAANWDPGLAHSVAVVSVLMGDLTQGQDPALTTSLAQRDVSGVARGSEVWVGSAAVAVDVQTLWIGYGAEWLSA